MVLILIHDQRLRSTSGLRALGIKHFRPLLSLGVLHTQISISSATCPTRINDSSPLRDFGLQKSQLPPLASSRNAFTCSSRFFDASPPTNRLL
jgi:hypothetical protein